MSFLILRKYKPSKEEIEKFNLWYKERYVFYDYKNKHMASGGLEKDEKAFDRLLKANKHRFKRKAPKFTISYEEYRKQRQQEFNEISNKYIFYAFSDAQFKDGLKKFNLTTNKEDLDKLCDIGYGGYMLKDGKQELENFVNGDALKEHMKNLKFAISAFEYELGNHEYILTYDMTDTLEALDLSFDDLEKNAILNIASRIAKKRYKQWYIDNDLM